MRGPVRNLLCQLQIEPGAGAACRQEMVQSQPAHPQQQGTGQQGRDDGGEDDEGHDHHCLGDQRQPALFALQRQRKHDQQQRHQGAARQRHEHRRDPALPRHEDGFGAQ